MMVQHLSNVNLFIQWIFLMLCTTKSLYAIAMIHVNKMLFLFDPIPLFGDSSSREKGNKTFCYPWPLASNQKDRPTPSTFPEWLICPIMNVHIPYCCIDPFQIAPKLSLSLVFNLSYWFYDVSPSSQNLSAYVLNKDPGILCQEY